MLADDPYQTARVAGQNCTFDVESSGTSPETGRTYHLTYQIALNAIHGLSSFLGEERRGSVAAIIYDSDLGTERCGSTGLRPWED